MSRGKQQKIVAEWSEKCFFKKFFSNVDIIIRPYEWAPGAIKAYVKTMYVTIEEDELEQKYHQPAPMLNDGFDDF